MIEKVASWLGYNPRTRLVFVSNKYPGLPFVDLGFELASAIVPHIGSQALPMVAEQCAKDIIRNHKQHDSVVGYHVAIDNWGILLEPELSIDFAGFMESVSRNTTVFLLTDEPIRNDRYHGLDLSNLQYLTI